MKLLKIFSIFLTTLLLFSSCSQPEKKDSIDVPQAETETETETETEGINSNEENNTDTSETVTTTVHPRDEQNYYSASLLKVADPPTEYNGEELAITMRIENQGDEFEQAFFIFINGERIEYSTEEYTDKKAYHIYNIPVGGVVDVTMHFTPYNCKKGEKAIVSITSMTTPDYMLSDLSYVSFGLHHNIHGFWPFEISINRDAPENGFNKISTDFETVEITEEYAKEQGYEYEIIDENGKRIFNLLEGCITFRMYQEDPLESYMMAKDMLSLNITAHGSEEGRNGQYGKYLVGIYINHELQKAFGDSYYAVCDIGLKNETRIKANIDVSKLSGLNHIYMIAAPYNPDEVEFGTCPDKTPTVLLFVGDESEITGSSQ